VDPHTLRVVKRVSARALWVKILQNRMETGEPYIMFEEAVQNELPDFQKRKGLQVHHSNLCSEITLATNDERTAVCCLSSVSLEYYDEWKDHPAFIPDLIRMLDNVLTSFIENAPSQLEKAKFSAYRERSIGLGAMGFHAFLQKNNVPFESAMASQYNLEMFDFKIDDGKNVSIKPKKLDDDTKRLWGMNRSLINNAIIGTSVGFEKVLELSGVGYRAALKGKQLNLQLGFSHDINFDIPEDVKILVEKQTTIKISGVDKQKVGMIASKIKSFRPPEPYKGKGIKEKGQYILRKEGKKK